jgi:hypothetical protein
MDNRIIGLGLLCLILWGLLVFTAVWNWEVSKEVNGYVEEINMLRDTCDCGDDGGFVGLLNYSWRLQHE